MLRALTSFLLPAIALGLSINNVRAASNITSVTPQFFLNEGSKRVQVPYGPYTAPPSSQMGGMKTFTELVTQMPCTDCLITWMQADLHYVNGTSANADTGLWLHHTVLANTAQEDLFCGQALPQRIFASGNERTAVDITVSGTDKAGLYVPSNASFAIETDLMNMVDVPADAIMTITYEYIPSPPPSFAHVQMLWLDIGKAGGCKGSDMPAFANSTFNYSSMAWTAPTDGRVTFMVSHLHDGGTHINIKNNDNVVCDSVAKYGQTPAYIGAMPMSMNMTMNGMTMEMNKTVEDISSISTCSNVGMIKAGDKWSLEAYYNTDKYMPMMSVGGSLMPIMGISLVYFVEGTYVNGTDGKHILMNEAAGQSIASKSSGKGSPSTSGGMRSTILGGSGVWALICLGLFTLL